MPLAMTIKEKDGPADALRGQGLMAIGDLLGALAASSCCILPIVLFSLGVSGVWIGNLTQIAPYQPYIIAATLAFLGGGYACTRKLPNRLVTTGLVLATLLVVAALGFDFVAPLLLD